MPRLTFVIPVYRNRGSIHSTYTQIVGMLRSNYPDFDSQFIFVDDGSDDGSLDEILELRREDARVEALSLSRNFGQVPAIMAGLRIARGDAVVVMSADLQDPVDLIAEMVHEWQGGNQVVVCYRIAREDSYIASWTSRIFYKLIRLSVPNMPSGGFDYVLLDRQPCEVLARLRDRTRFFQGDVLWLGFRAKFIPYERRRRTIGRSQWTLAKKVKYFIDGLLNTSYLPIRFMSLVGLLTAVSGFAYAVVVVYIRLTGQQPYIGYAPVVIVNLVVGGVIMVMLGIIGEYIWRIYDEARSRPLYVVKDRYTTDEADDEDADGPAPGAGARPSTPVERRGPRGESLR
jgi:dolichol-phosphate mannosyltransferase